jgi:hypothetical protein
VRVELKLEAKFVKPVWRIELKWGRGRCLPVVGLPAGERKRQAKRVLVPVHELAVQRLMVRIEIPQPFQHISVLCPAAGHRQTDRRLLPLPTEHVAACASIFQ